MIRVPRHVAEASPAEHQFVPGGGYVYHGREPPIPTPAARRKPCDPPEGTKAGSLHILKRLPAGEETTMRWGGGVWRPIVVQQQIHARRMGFTPDFLSRAGWTYLRSADEG